MNNIEEKTKKDKTHKTLCFPLGGVLIPKGNISKKAIAKLKQEWEERYKGMPK